MQDSDILDLYFARDERAIRETANKYGLSLTRLSENITGSHADAEECVSDTYLAAWNAIPPTRPVHFFAWLARVVRNRSCTVVEARTRGKRTAEWVELTCELSECLPSESDIPAEVESVRLGRVLDEFIRTLDADTRYIFMQRYFYSASLHDIVAATGYSESKLKSTLYRTRQKLKKILEKEEFSV